MNTKMTDVRIYDRYFKAIIIEILQWEIPSPFKTNEKIENSQGRNKKESKMGN